MKKYYLILFILFLFVFAVSNGYSQTAALQGLTNIAKFTAGNVPTAVQDTNTGVTTATMYGGELTVSPAASAGSTIVFPGIFQFDITVTNRGNAQASFTASVVASNTNYLGGNFTWRFVNDTVNNIAPDNPGTFQLIISNSAPCADDAWFSLLVKVSNLTTATARAYMGSDTTTWYGGDLGIATNYSATNADPIIYLQHSAFAAPLTNEAGFLTVIVQGPVLRISKTISSITHPSGLYLGDNTKGEPGAYITYNIYVSNVGGANATNVAIVDTFATQYVEYVSAVDGTYFSNAGTNGNTITFVTFSGTNDRLPAGANDLIQIVVRIK